MESLDLSGSHTLPMRKQGVCTDFALVISLCHRQRPGAASISAVQDLQGIRNWRKEEPLIEKLVQNAMLGFESVLLLLLHSQHDANRYGNLQFGCLVGSGRLDAGQWPTLTAAEKVETQLTSSTGTQ